MKIRHEDMRMYLVTDRSWLKPGETLARQVETALEAGATCVQLREKHAGREEFLALARERGIPAIAALGRKGGSTVAAALCNALLYQSGGREKL